MSASKDQTPGILMLGVVIHAHAEFEELGKIGQVQQVTTGTRSEFIEDCKKGVYDNVVAISRTFDSVQITGPFDAELVSHLPSSLKSISHNGAGYDQIDVPSCTKRGIVVSNTPQAVDAATANIALYLILGALRCSWIAETAIRKGLWRGESPLGHDPDGLTLGILGMGGIGTATAQRAAAFGFKLQYHNRSPVQGLEKSFSNAAEVPKYVSFDELLETSDVISVHLPLGPATRKLISAKEIARMKKGVIIVNTARGLIIDENDLYNALEEGQVGSVGLDVYEKEPEVHAGLLKHQRAVLLPHIGTATVETQKKMEVLVIDNVKSVITKGTLLTPVSK
ncbi:hypothetical protein BLS_004111 [Venturia inaequalis]|uniref:Hydroxyisocaproate dehydrogenase n=1 Tax=Venturia inaequalis TaxID=5025 RepID=A0A8H3UL31_VENIN|nr:hypothetical protein EG328_005958 [Venturia inaequalis]KAE9972239.1 hypothetical protein BLS_004111 [Venturia inaequalis]KAE9984570.1 hypothetical protein EG327_004983 [Venturia inaequalis]